MQGNLVTDDELTQRTKLALREELEALESKSEWEGGLGEMILDYGGMDMFPKSCRTFVAQMQDAYEGLRAELVRLSDYCGGTRNAW